MSAIIHTPLAERSYSPETSLELLGMRPGLVLVPYEERPSTVDSPSPYHQLLSLKAQLDDRGIACTMDLHRTQPLFERVPEAPRRDDEPITIEDLRGRYEQVQPARHFALFTLDGVGEPQQEVMQELVQPGGMLEGNTITLAGETYIPGIFHPRTAGGMAAAARPNLRPEQTPDPSELIDLLTSFSQGFTRNQGAEWQRLRDELDVLTAHHAYLRTAPNPQVTYVDIEAQRTAIKAKNAQIREFLARTTTPNAAQRVSVGTRMATLLRSVVL
jgi:hypothetical protein